jgi:preprotein translocase subunit SecD
VLGGIVVLLWALVFGTGNHKPAPQLGLDLKGGTTVTLTAVTEHGKTPNPDQLQTAKQIISQRVNGLGVAEAQVVTEGNDRIVISVPGKKGDAVKQIAQTAQLRFRQVLQAQQTALPQAPTPSTTPTPNPSGTPSPAPSSSMTPQPSASPSQGAQSKVSAKPSGSSQKRPLSAALSAASPSPSASPSAKTGSTGNTSSAGSTPSGSGGPVVSATDPYAGIPAQQLFANPKVTCKDLNSRPPGATDNVKAQVVACDQNGVKYLLDRAKVVGTDIKSANFGQDPNNLGGWQVNLSFTGSGQGSWTNLTKQAFGASPPKNQVAIVLDGKVVSAPAIQSVIPGPAQITGSFTRNQAQQLANVLKYGALPLTFQTSQALTVSPTLGTEQLKAGLLAGGIGLALVVIYSLVYYRVLGLATISSLVISGAIVYSAVVLLGRYVGFTLSLAGIAGFIVAVGITADSFVVFFERLKDEAKEGRTVRSSVPRAWVRARRTILSADTVSFLAAVVLYLFAAGDVKGFAFTLGLSTIIDVVVVFLFTHPLIAWASHFRAFDSGRITGLGHLRPRQPAPALAGAAGGGTRTRRAAGRRTSTPKEF